MAENPNEKRQEKDAQFIAELDEDLSTIRQAFADLDGELGNIGDRLLGDLRRRLSALENEAKQDGFSYHFQDGVTITGPRKLYRLTPRLAAWVRSIQDNSGCHGMLRVIHLDGREYLEPTSKA